MTPGWNRSPPGPNVHVQPANQTTGEMPANLTFDDVTAGGMTTLISVTPSESQGPPGGFKFGTLPAIFDIITSVTVSQISRR